MSPGSILVLKRGSAENISSIETCGASAAQAGRIGWEILQANLLIGLNVPDEVLQSINTLLNSESELVVYGAQVRRH